MCGLSIRVISLGFRRYGPDAFLENRLKKRHMKVTIMSKRNKDKKIAEQLSRTALLMLIIGFVAFALSGGRWNIALMAWIWPFAFLYFSRQTKSKKQFMLLAMAIVVGHTIKWLNILNAGYILDAVLCAVWSLCWVAVFAVDRLLYDKFNGFVSTLLFPAAIVSMEFLRTFTLLGSFGAAAYTQTGFMPLVQITSIIGTFGLSFLIMWFGSVLVHVADRNIGWKKTVAVYVAIMIAVVAYGGVRMIAVPVDYSETVRVASIISPFYRLFSDGEYETIPYEDSKEYLIYGAERAAAGGGEIAAWNEEAFAIKDSEEEDFLKTAKALSEKYDMDMVLAYETEDTDDSEEGLSVNKLMIITPDGDMTEYIKTKLVPVIEAAYYVKGTGQIPTVVTEKAVISAIICFDDSYVSYVRGFGAETDAAFDDTEILFVPSWDWNSVDKAHTDANEFRAIENGLSVVKPTYDGISTAVDHQGHVINKFDTDDTGYDTVQFADVPTDSTNTFYSRFGTVIDIIFGLFGIVLVIVGIVRGRRKTME